MAGTGAAGGGRVAPEGEGRPKVVELHVAIGTPLRDQPAPPPEEPAEGAEKAERKDRPRRTVFIRGPNISPTQIRTTAATTMPKRP